MAEAGFRQRSLRILEDPGVRESVTGAALLFDGRRADAYAEIDSDRWRDWARAVKDYALSDLPALLETAERQLEQQGAVVHWAVDASEARRIVGDLVRQHQIRRMVKAKSMLSEELGINPFLEELGVEVFETDLGEYILQLAGDPPSHIVAPAIHRRLEEVQELFGDHLGTPADAGPDELAAAARTLLRQAFLTADAGMSGANFLVAETGTIALIENEGNIRLTTSAPPVHIALVGIEKVIPLFEDLAGFLQLTARAALGMRIGTFVSLIHGPRGISEPDGPEHLHVVLVDNGRSRMLADPEAWETLRCVRCGACQNVCPVYRQIGGHGWDWVYGGPIGSILAPGLLGLSRSYEYPYASSLCGACADVCPVRIPIPELLHTWRGRAVAERRGGLLQRLGMRLYAAAMRRPALYRLAGRLLRRLPDPGRLPVLRTWSGGRGAPEPSPRSFSELWKEGIR